MSFLSSPKKPKIPTPPTNTSEAVQSAQDEARRAALLAQGRSSTILTGNGGLGNVG